MKYLPNPDVFLRLAKFWQLFKYCHPAFTDTEQCCDAFFNQCLTDLQNGFSFEEMCQTHIERYFHIYNLFERTSDRGEQIHNLPVQFSWITNRQILSASLGAHLEKIYKNRTRNQRYLDIKHPDPQPIFLNESYCNTIESRDPNSINFLAIVRLWAAIDLVYPFRRFLQNWDFELIKAYQALRINPKIDLKDLLQEMLLSLEDGHAQHIQSSKILYKFKPPIGIIKLENKYLISGSETQTIPVGSTVVKINGKCIYELERDFQRHATIRNKRVLSHLFAQQLLFGPNNSTVKVDLMISGKRISQAITRGPKLNKWAWPTLNGPCCQIINGAGYIKFNKASLDDVRDFLYCSTNGHFEGYIIDLRCYPGHGFFELITEFFLDKKRYFAKSTQFVKSSIGKFHTLTNAPISPKSRNVGAPLAILIDESTMSHAEYFVLAMSVRPNTVKIGTPTAGANGNISILPLPDGSSVRFSGIEILDSNNNPHQGFGIKPDIYASNTERSLLLREDKVVQAALHWIARKVDKCEN